MNELNTIKEKIRTINPEITDELLDLLYEYFLTRHVNDFRKNVSSDNLSEILQYFVNPLKN